MAKMAERPSSANQQILRLAEAERRRLGHPYLGDEHLLLGMLAHAANPAAAMLAERGFELDATRSEIAGIVAASGPVARDAAALLGELGVDVVQMRRRLESTFGALAVHEAVRQGAPPSVVARRRAAQPAVWAAVSDQAGAAHRLHQRRQTRRGRDRSGAPALRRAARRV
jgi:ATP-dependent Clp protease ATP-binding subunit ClpA